MEPIPEVDLIPLMELIPVVEPIPFIDMIPTLMIPIPTYPHCSKGDSDSDSKNNWNHNTSSASCQEDIAARRMPIGMDADAPFPNGKTSRDASHHLLMLICLFSMLR